MSIDDADQLQSGVTRILHRDGAEGIYKGCYIDGGLQLLVDVGGRTAVWPVGDCEVAR